MEFEREIKLKVEDLGEIEKKLLEMGARFKDHCFERNYLFDRDGELFRRGEALRLRVCDQRAVLTYKGRPIKDPNFKVREEIQTGISSPDAMAKILEKLGFRPAFYYEKERKNYLAGDVLVSLDRTPLGNFVEVEGEPEAIDRICRSLGFSRNHYIKKTYVEMALEKGLSSLKF